METEHVITTGPLNPADTAAVDSAWAFLIKTLGDLKKPKKLGSADWSELYTSLYEGACPESRLKRSRAFAERYIQLQAENPQLPARVEGTVAVVNAESALHDIQCSRDFAHAELIERSLLDALEKWPIYSRQEQVGYLALALILWGGVTKSSVTRILLLSSADRLLFDRYGTVVVVIKNATADTSRVDLCLPPICSLLVMIMQKEGHLALLADGDLVKKSVQAVLKTLVPPRKGGPTSVRGIVNCAKARLRVLMPRFLADVITEETETHSFGFRTYSMEDIVRKCDHTEPPPEFPKLDVRTALESRWLNPSAPFPVKFTECFDKNALHLLSLISEWLVDVRRLTKNKGSRAWCGSGELIFWRILEVAGEQDLKDIDVSTWTLIYAGLMEYVRGHTQKLAMQSHVRKWHKFLGLRVPGTRKLKFSEIDGYDRAEPGVRTTPIHPKEWERTLEVSRKAPPLARLSTLLALLGLRVSDISRLSINSIVPGRKSLYIDVHASKSVSGERHIPAHCFLDEEDIEFLKSFRENAKEREQFCWDSPLIDIAEERRNDDIRLMVSTVLREATGRSNLTPHCLRHAFASFIVLAWYCRNHDKVLCQERYPEFSDRLERFMQAVGSISAIAGPTIDRAFLWNLAGIIGHLTPGTTLKSYIHTASMVSQLELAQIQTKLHYRTAASLLGYHVATIYRLCKTDSQGYLSPMEQMKLVEHYKRCNIKDLDNEGCKSNDVREY